MAEKQSNNNPSLMKEDNSSGVNCIQAESSAVKIRPEDILNGAIGSISFLEQELQTHMTTLKHHLKIVTDCAFHIENVQQQLIVEITNVKKLSTENNAQIPIFTQNGNAQNTEVPKENLVKSNGVVNSSENSVQVGNTTQNVNQLNDKSGTLQTSFTTANRDKTNEISDLQNGDLFKELPGTSVAHKQPSVAPKTTSYNYFPCNICTRVFKNRPGLRKHIKSHSEKVFRCKVCPDSSFRGQEELETHKLSHSFRGLFHCKLCDEYFTRASALYVHIRAHKKTKGIKNTCRICAKTYLTPALLRVHHKTHYPAAKDSK